MAPLSMQRTLVVVVVHGVLPDHFPQYCWSTARQHNEPDVHQNGFGDGFDFGLCLPPVTEQRFCQTQTIASTPIGRIRTVMVPDVIGMTLEQAQLALQANRLVLGDITFERTTAVPAGQIIRQDMPRKSIMPPNTAINLVIATRGVINE